MALSKNDALADEVVPLTSSSSSSSSSSGESRMCDHPRPGRQRCLEFVCARHAPVLIRGSQVYEMVLEAKRTGK
jgi:hypothetical protein